MALKPGDIVRLTGSAGRRTHGDDHGEVSLVVAVRDEPRDDGFDWLRVVAAGRVIMVSSHYVGQVPW